MPPLSLYIHIPYCVHKCPYCDFHSRVDAVVPQADYVDALLIEMRYWRARLQGDKRNLHTLFLGGGTPSLFDPEQIARLLQGIAQIWPLSPTCEITLESNPESLTKDRLAGYRQAGVTRISMGVQALDDARLQRLDRPHNRSQAQQALAWLGEAGFRSWSADLIYATPDHTLEGWLKELDEILAYSPPHLSCYALTVEPGTPFFQQQREGGLHIPEDEQQLVLMDATYERLSKAGLPPYEISNFARVHHPCRHNQNYWQFGDYLGVGVAAHGKVTDAAGRVVRSANLADAARYFSRLQEEGVPPLVRDMLLSPQEAGNEALVMGLRTMEGLNKATYQQARGKPVEQTVGGDLSWFLKQGLVAHNDTHIWLTSKGLRLGDGVMSELMEMEL
ncbi:radical SAM family heme chaperone HemW [Magnetococcus sp. PR-3]|uniref:radical SAM family heme chaperone HemW n=1 Tax=Magnetococcus sp. PR-3 TaxID=3120355 RepID=UPI002FCE4459